MAEKKMVLYDSPEAASIKTVTGWVSSRGHFWGENEHMARYDGSTHKKCAECGTIHRQNSWCEPCHRRKADEKWNNMPSEPWDGESPLFSNALDKFFFNGEVADYFFDGEDGFENEDGTFTPYSEENLRLQHCKPRFLHHVDTSYWEDVLDTEDGEQDLPSEVEVALDALNKAISAAGPVTWEPKPVRVSLPITIVCPGCSEAGGADRAIYRLPPVCKEAKAVGQ